MNKKETEDLFNRIKELEESLALLSKVKPQEDTATAVKPTAKSSRKKPKERVVPPVVYAFGVGIKCVCPICGRTSIVGVCPETEKRIKKGKVPTEVELPCGDKVPLIISR